MTAAGRAHASHDRQRVTNAPARPATAKSAPRLLLLQRAAGNRAVTSALTRPAIQRACGSGCDCATCSDAERREPEPIVQRDRIAAAGFPQPLNEKEEFAASHKRDKNKQPILSCWEPQSQDFKASSGGTASGSFDEFIQTLKSRGGAKQDVTLIGHGTGRAGGFFGFGGPVNKVNGCDEVHFTRATGISIESVAAKQADLAIAGKALSSLTLAACNAGVDPVMVQRLANAIGVCVKAFQDPVTMCLGGNPGSFLRGKVNVGTFPGDVNCQDLAALSGAVTTCPEKKPGGAVVRDVSFDQGPGSSVDVLDDNAPLTIAPVQITSLTPGGRARARAFYAAQPDRYTRDFITKMQKALGLAQPSGKIDDPTLDAMVVFQDSHPPLKGDGMAGPRTLSRLMNFGLATHVDEQEYADLIEDAADDFRPGSSIDDRLGQAWGAVIPSLTQEQVTPIPDVAKQDGSGSEGAFSVSDWTAFISTKLLDPVPIPNDKRLKLKETVYHEARHAEQVYSIGRMLAAKGRTVNQITRLIGTTQKPEVAAEAKSRPLKRGTPEFVVAEEMFEAVHGAGAKRHDKLEKEVVEKRKALDAALAAAGNNRADPKVVKAQGEYDAVHAQYADLADEADAFATGSEAAKTERELEF
jgi:hypothetical protein